MWDRLYANNTLDMHLRKKKRNNKQKKEQAKAKKTEKGFRQHGASEEEICVSFLNAVGVSSSQISQYVDGKMRNNMGRFFFSQDCLALAADFVLSLSQEEDEIEDDKNKVFIQTSI